MNISKFISARKVLVDLMSVNPNIGKEFLSVLYSAKVFFWLILYMYFSSVFFIGLFGLENNLLMCVILGVVNGILTGQYAIYVFLSSRNLI